MTMHDCTFLPRMPFLLWASLILLGCVDPRVDHVWKHHESVFEDALNGHQVDDDLGETWAFFERLTGMKLHIDTFTLGYVLKPGAENDLLLLRAWYKQNRHRLYWDEVAKRVELRPEDRRGR